MALQHLAIRVFKARRYKSTVLCTNSVFGVAGCASLPEYVDRVPSQAKDGSGTALGAIVSRVLQHVRENLPRHAGTFCARQTSLVAMNEILQARLAVLPSFL
jgi:hypothetical protein